MFQCCKILNKDIAGSVEINLEGFVSPTTFQNSLEGNGFSPLNFVEENVLYVSNITHSQSC